MNNKIAIIGAGIVGNGMRHIFPDALMVDPPKGLASYHDALDCELGIVCVPSPMRPDGSCDTSYVEAAVEELETDIILIKSTITPGTTERLRKATQKRLVFSPEYMGESRYYVPPAFLDPRNPISHGFVILGGDPFDCSQVIDLLLPRMGPTTRFRCMSSTEAEIVKYAENSFFAMKVTFANELRRICEAAGVNYHVVREGWIDDPRVNPNHSAAFADQPGFGGKCLPKDINALAAFCRSIGMQPGLLEAVIAANSQPPGRP